MNVTLSGLNRILVGEGITVEVRSAREVSAFHSSDRGLPVNGSLVIDKEKSVFWPFWPFIFFFFFCQLGWKLVLSMNSTKKSKEKRKPSEGLDRCHYPASQRQKSVFPNEPSCHFRGWHPFFSFFLQLL